MSCERLARSPIVGVQARRPGFIRSEPNRIAAYRSYALAECLVRHIVSARTAIAMLRSAMTFAITDRRVHGLR